MLNVNELPHFPVIYRELPQFARFELSMAARKIDARFNVLSEEDQAEFAKLAESAFQSENQSDKAALNKAVAEHNGISVVDLINSPNMETLIRDYRMHLVTSGSETVVAWLQEKLEDCLEKDLYRYIYVLLGLDDVLPR